jgi:hypothetical protein
VEPRVRADETEGSSRLRRRSRAEDRLRREERGDDDADGDASRDETPAAARRACLRAVSIVAARGFVVSRHESAFAGGCGK